MTLRHRPAKRAAEFVDSSNIGQRFGLRSFNEEEAVNHALRIAAQVTPFHAASYWTVKTDDERRTVTRSYTYGEYPALFCVGGTENDIQDPHSHGIMAMILREEKPVYIDDYQNHPLADSGLTAADLHEACYIPIHVRRPDGKKLVGILAAVNFNKRVGHISSQAISLLEAAVYQLQMSLEYLEAMIQLDDSLTMQRKLYDSIRDISTAQTASEALETLLECLQVSFDVSAAFVSLVNSEGTHTVLGSKGLLMNPLFSTLQGRIYTHWTEITQDRSKSLASHLREAPEMEPSALELCKQSMDWVVICPLIAAGETIGYAVSFGSAVLTEPLHKTIVQLCTVYSGVYSSLVETERARVTKVESLSALGIALESRDGETFGHTQRVVGMMSRFVEVLNLGPLDREQGVIGAYLHDIGKMSIPDSILLKPGALTPDERKLIESHTLHGYNLAKRLPFMSDGALDMILSHHERWDGMGYPNGLSGAEIPLLARVFALIDVYDALTHARPYKSAWSREDAAKYIAEHAGSQFDPNLTRVFLQLIDSAEV